MNFSELNEMELYSAKKCAVYFADRCELLEKLCLDMYEQSKMCQGHAHYPCLDFDYITDRMKQLGLLDGEKND